MLPAEPPAPSAVRALLTEAFPDECRTIGSENLTDLSEGWAAFEDDAAASRLSTVDTVGLLADAVTIIAFAWAFRPRRTKVDALSYEEIDAAVRASVPESARLSKERRIAIYVAIAAAKRSARL